MFIFLVNKKTTTKFFFFMFFIHRFSPLFSVLVWLNISSIWQQKNHPNYANEDSIGGNIS